MRLELTLPSEAPVEESVLLCQGHRLLSLAWLSSCLPAPAQLLFTVGPGGHGVAGTAGALPGCRLISMLSPSTSSAPRPEGMSVEPAFGGSSSLVPLASSPS